MITVMRDPQGKLVLINLDEADAQWLSLGRMLKNDDPEHFNALLVMMLRELLSEDGVA